MIQENNFLNPPQILKTIRKRDGRVVPFDGSRIENAVFKALEAQGQPNREIAAKLTQEVVEKLAKKHKRIKQIPTIEEVQDLVEEILVEAGYAKIAKAYILYREKRGEIRREKQEVLNKEEIDEVDKKFDINALRVLVSRYLRKDEDGKAIESPKQLFTRVALQIGLADVLFDQKVSKKVKALPEYKADPNYKKFDIKEAESLEGKLKVGKYSLNKFHIQSLHLAFTRLQNCGLAKISWEKLVLLLKQDAFKDYEKTVGDYFDLMVSKRFFPNTPTLANFGASFGMGSACFVLGVEDSMESIMETLKQTAFIHQAGGGTGFYFGNLRPEGDFVNTTAGTASGPISFMRLYDFLTDVIKQGGMRRGANMGILPSDSPDIEKFVTAKQGNQALRNFNISILIKPEFWECYEKNKPYPLVNPRTGKIVRYISARSLWDRIIYQAWESAEPGVIFYDHLNKYNPFLKSLGPLTATNPCVVGETLVSTEKGLERIDELSSKRITIDKRAKRVVLKKVAVGASKEEEVFQKEWQSESGTESAVIEKAFPTGKKPVWKLETRSGYEIIGTADHHVLTVNGWKPFILLNELDKVLIQSGEGRFNANKKLPFVFSNKIVGKNGRIYNYNLPKEWSYELGLVLGWTIGDGWLNDSGPASQAVGWVFSKADREAEEKIRPILEKYFNNNLNLIKREGLNQYKSRSESVVNYFKKLGVKPANQPRELPFTLFKSTKEAQKGFLCGLFSSDGTVAISNESRKYARLNSSSLKLLKQVQVLLINLGIKSSIYNRSTKSKNFIYKTADNQTRIYKTSGINYELNISKESLVKFIKGIGFLQTKKYGETISKITDQGFYKDYFVDSVKSISYFGEAPVYDLTEPESHSFIGNGFVLHNCGEQPLYPSESCNLGSINLWSFVKENSRDKKIFDWQEFEKTIRLATRFLNNVIDINRFPLPQIEEMTFNTRKIGLGLMGLSELLFELELPYNSPSGRKFMEKIAEFLNYYSKLESIELAKTRGIFPYFNKSFYSEGKMPFSAYYDKKSWNLDWSKIAIEIKKHGLRNSLTTTIAPSGTISMIAGTSSGIEPVYSLVFQKNTPIGSFYYVDPIFEQVMSREGLFDEVLIKDVVANKGSIQKIHYIPSKFKKYFLSAYDVIPDDHIYALAAFSKWIDNAISKTNNLPANAATSDVERSYLLAYKLGIKDVTIYRDSSIKGQTLVVETKKKEKKEESVGHLVSVKDEKAGGPAIYHAPAGSLPVRQAGDAKIVAASAENGEADIVNYQTPQNCPQCQI